MARFIGIEIPDEKKIKISLCYIYGIGQPRALDILKKANVDPEKRTKDLTSDETSRIQALVEHLKLEGELRQEIGMNVTRLKEIRAYRGIRHKLGLPVRGQRTRHNAHTRKGRGLAVGGLKHKLEKT